MGNESRPSNNGKPMGLITEATESVSNSSDSSPTIAASERALNGAILAAEISESYEEYLEIFDHFYADDIHATADGLQEPVVGKAAVRARLAGFLVPLHVLAEIVGVSVSIQWSPITGDRSDETHSAWTLELRGVTGASCRVTWCSRRRWRAGRVLSEHHYDHRQIGGPLTFSDLRLSGDRTAGNVSTPLAKPQ
jgi:hypothetical protein